MNTTENNRLIAEFMGLKPVKFGDNYQWSDSPFYYVSHDTHEKVMQSIAEYSKYHSSWDWLMPVVEKIETLNTDGEEQFYITTQFDNREDFKGWNWDIEKGLRTLKIDEDRTQTKIQACYNAVIWFIQWYNQQSKK